SREALGNECARGRCSSRTRCALGRPHHRSVAEIAKLELSIAPEPRETARGGQRGRPYGRHLPQRAPVRAIDACGLGDAGEDETIAAQERGAQIDAGDLGGPSGFVPHLAARRARGARSRADDAGRTTLEIRRVAVAARVDQIALAERTDRAGHVAEALTQIAQFATER